MSAIPQDQAAGLRLLAAASCASTVHAAPEQRRARVIAICSGKGGVGKTNIAVNLALRLSQIGQHVTLIDVDLGTANADVLMNVQAQYDLSHILYGRGLDEIATTVNERLRVVVGASGLTGMADMSAFHRQEIIEELGRFESESDFILLDCGAGVSQNVLAFAQAADEVLVVTTPEPPALTDAYALIKMLTLSNDAPPIGVIVNMADSFQEADDVAQRLTNVAARFLQIKISAVGRILRDSHLPLAVQQRDPFILRFPYCPAAQGISVLAERLAKTATHTSQPSGFFRRLIGLFY